MNIAKPLCALVLSMMSVSSALADALSIPGQMQFNQARRLNQSRQSLKYYDAAIAANPAELTWRRCRAYALVLNREYKRALEDLNLVLKAHPNDYECLVERAGCLAELGQDERAISDFEAVLRYEPSDWHALVSLSRLYQRKGNAKKASDYYHTAVTTYGYTPSCVNLIMSLNNADQSTHTFEAIRELKQQIRMTPQCPMLYKLLFDQYGISAGARVFNSQAEDISADELIATDEQCLKVAPPYGRTWRLAYTQEGRTYRDSNRSGQAIKCFETALKGYDPKAKVPNITQDVLWEIYWNRGRTYKAIGKKSLAAADFERAFKLNEIRDDVLLWLAQLHEQLDQKERALADYTLLLRMNPENGDALYARLQLLTALRRNSEALDMLNNMIKNNPEDDERLMDRARLYCQLGNYDKALADLSAAIKLSPDTSRYYVARADVLTKLGKVQLAKQDQEKAKKLR